LMNIAKKLQKHTIMALTVFPTSHVLLIYMHKNKGHNYYYSTSERQSSYNQNNFIILMKFNTNRNNVIYYKYIFFFHIHFN
jgi:hypothetical protein